MAPVLLDPYTLFPAAGGGGPYTGPTIIGKAFKNAAGGATSIAIAQADFDVAPASGDKVLLLIATYFNTKFGSMTPPATFVGTGSGTGGDGFSPDSMGLYLYQKTAGGSEGTYTFSIASPTAGAGAGHALCAIAMRGGSTPAYNAGSGANGTSLTGPTITPAVDNALCIIGYATASTSTAPGSYPHAGWTSLGTTQNGATSVKLYVAYQQLQVHSAQAAGLTEAGISDRCYNGGAWV